MKWGHCDEVRWGEVRWVIQTLLYLQAKIQPMRAENHEVLCSAVTRSIGLRVFYCCGARIEKTICIRRLVYEYTTREKWHFWSTWNREESDTDIAAVGKSLGYAIAMRLHASAIENLLPTISCGADRRAGYCVTRGGNATWVPRAPPSHSRRIHSKPRVSSRRIIYDQKVRALPPAKLRPSARHIIMARLCELAWCREQTARPVGPAPVVKFLINIYAVDPPTCCKSPPSHAGS